MDTDKKFDYGMMDDAAKEAEAELRDAIEQEPDLIKMCQFHKKWFMRAGHKRLGRLYLSIAKEYEGDK